MRRTHFSISAGLSLAASDVSSRSLIVQRIFTSSCRFPLVLVFIGNEQISRQMSKSPTTTNIIFDDLDTFVRNAHMQMTFVATSSTDLVIEAIRRDLEGARKQ
jgi:hypothetical protein